MEMVVNYLNFFFLTEVKTKYKYRTLNFVFQFIKKTKWYVGYTDCLQYYCLLHYFSREERDVEKTVVGQWFGFRVGGFDRGRGIDLSVVFYFEGNKYYGK